MTAIVAILNKQGVALAADSAVTIGRGEKVLLSANKLFTLSKRNPVGIAVFGSAEFLGVPWDVVIKTYRAQRYNDQHDSLEQFALDFIEYLKTDESLFPVDAQQRYLKNTIRGYLRSLQLKFDEGFKKGLATSGSQTPKDIGAIADRIIAAEHKNWKTAPEVVDLAPNHESSARNKYKELIQKAISEVFERFPLSDSNKAQLVDISIWLTFKRPMHMRAPGDAGIVISGYGRKDIYPHLRSFMLFGLLDGVLNYVAQANVDISTEKNSTIVPFAQDEMVKTFMEGMDPMLGKALEGNLGRIFDELPVAIAGTLSALETGQRESITEALKSVANGFMDRYRQELREFQIDQFIRPVIDMVGALPKDELASMAEALVNLTSFKRHVSRQVESVGGPIDVAVISKGDGFIWIKRKHYFDAKLNHHFQENYFRPQD